MDMIQYWADQINESDGRIERLSEVEANNESIVGLIKRWILIEHNDEYEYSDGSKDDAYDEISGVRSAKVTLKGEDIDVHFENQKHNMTFKPGKDKLKYYVTNNDDWYYDVGNDVKLNRTGYGIGTLVQFCAQKIDDNYNEGSTQLEVVSEAIDDLFDEFQRYDLSPDAKNDNLIKRIEYMMKRDEISFSEDGSIMVNGYIDVILIPEGEWEDQKKEEPQKSDNEEK